MSPQHLSGRATATSSFPTSSEQSPGYRRAVEKVLGMLHYPKQLQTHGKATHGKSACGGEGSKDCACSIYTVGTARPHHNPSYDTLLFTVRALQGRCLGTGTQASSSALPSCSLQIRLQQLWGHSASSPLPVLDIYVAQGEEIPHAHTHTRLCTRTQLTPFRL